jgi:hypothetical protein
MSTRYFNANTFCYHPNDMFDGHIIQYSLYVNNHFGNVW